LATNHSSMFWLGWSAIVSLLGFIFPIAGIAISVGNVFISLQDHSPLGVSVGQLAGAAAATRMFLQLATHRVPLQHHIWRESHFAFGAIVFVMLLSASLSPFPGIPWYPLLKLL